MASTDQVIKSIISANREIEHNINRAEDWLCAREAVTGFIATILVILLFLFS